MFRDLSLSNFESVQEESLASFINFIFNFHLFKKYQYLISIFQINTIIVN